MRSITILTVVVCCQAAHAHHGFGNFDMNADVEITGTVTELALVNPHSWLYLEVVAENGDILPYRCEMRSATTLRRSGWTPEMFPAGARVTIQGSPDRRDPHACYVSTVIFADGSSIDRYGQRTPPTPAQTAPRAARLASGEPNISGEWAAEQLVMTDPRGQTGTLVPLSQASSLEPGALPEGQGPIPGGRGVSPGGAPFAAGEVARRLFQARIELTEAGRQANAGRGDPSRLCEPISVLMDWSYDSPVNRITQHDDTIVLEYGKFDYARTIHMNRSAHPDGLVPSRTGHSIGRWENDVLIVDTIGFAPGALTRGLVHSERLHLVERFSLDEASMTLTRSFVAEDPLYFAEPFTGSDVVYPSNVPYAPAACDDRSLFPD